MTEENYIIITGAREHNLKNINLKLPRNKLVVVTGLSGSGKSSLVFDTIYAEGQRRYVESLSAYARQFLGQMQKPDVEHIAGLSPSIAIEQRSLSHNPRSTVGTLTEIYDYLRLVFARIGHPHCPKCGREISPQSPQQIIDRIMAFPEGAKVQVMAPLVRARKGEYRQLFERLRSQGFARVRVDGDVYGLEENVRLNKQKKHNIELVIDRIVIKKDVRSRVADSIELALRTADGLVLVSYSLPNERQATETVFSQHYACPECGVSIGRLEPRNFSFNSPFGACTECSGLGTKLEIDPKLVVPDENLSINEGALVPWSNPVTTRRHRWKHAWSSWYKDLLDELRSHRRFSYDIPFKKLPEQIKQSILWGDEEAEFEGIIPNLERRWRDTESDFVREEIYNKYMTTRICPLCNGARLKPESLAVTMGGKNIYQVTQLSIKAAQKFFEDLPLSPTEEAIAHLALQEIKARLGFLVAIGLDYLTLDRASVTLAGGEAQRINLATQIGSGLVGVVYALDEPSIGLHQRDNRRLLDTMCRLRDRGNTLIVVEHDESTIRRADYVVDLGPGAGANGGDVVYAGPQEELLKHRSSLTAKYLRQELSIPVPSSRRKPTGFLTVLGASEHNLKNIDVKIPLGVFVCITGVSGSGKSTLVDETLYRALARSMYNSREVPGKHRDIRGIENVDKVLRIDQSPIGRTPRSNPVTYTDTFAPIRQIFAQIPLARARGYKLGRFSFNVKGGRCENCQGDGLIKIGMQFLPDVYVPCEVCKGKRYNSETLDVLYKGKNIAEVLDMSVAQALEFFVNIPHLKEKLQTLYDVGLGYIKLGQPATTLSGGEAQRVKLSKELSKRATGHTLYLLDEPTTGLHFADVEKLLNVLHRLVERGNTVLIIEHNLEVIKTADYIIDLGPEGGDDGGQVVACGTPEEIVRARNSYTGRYLESFLKM